MYLYMYVYVYILFVNNKLVCLYEKVRQLTYMGPFNSSKPLQESVGMIIFGRMVSPLPTFISHSLLIFF